MEQQGEIFSYAIFLGSHWGKLSGVVQGTSCQPVGTQSASLMNHVTPQLEAEPSLTLEGKWLQSGFE